MKEKIASMIRHGLTSLPALGGYLLAKGWVTGDEAAQLDQAQGQVIAVGAAVLAGVAARVLLWLAAKYAPGLRGLLDGGQTAVSGQQSAGSGEKAKGGGGLFLWCVCMGVAGLLLGGCAGMQPMRITADGCALVGTEVTTDGTEGTYLVWVGGCNDERLVAEWDGPEAKVRGTRWPDGRVKIEYLTAEGWIEWDSKAGVQVGPVAAALGAGE